MAATFRFYLPWDFLEKNKERVHLTARSVGEDKIAYLLDEKVRLLQESDGRLYFSCEMGDFVPPNIEAREVTLKQHSPAKNSSLKSGPYKNARLGVSGEVEGYTINLRGPSEKNVTIFYWAIRAEIAKPVSAKQMFIEAKKGLFSEKKPQKTAQNKLKAFGKILLAKVSRLASSLKRRAISLLMRLPFIK